MRRAAAALLVATLANPLWADGGGVDEGEPAVRLGMPLDDALRALGEPPDDSRHIGAGCGVLDVYRWDALRLEVVGANGHVVSVTRKVGPGEAPAN